MKRRAFIRAGGSSITALLAPAPIFGSTVATAATVPPTIENKVVDHLHHIDQFKVTLSPEFLEFVRNKQQSRI
jgi:hypothetical protein